MPNKQPVNVRKSFQAPRARRTTTALAYALFALIQEGGGRFEDITVREILERAGVGRTAFYSHFRSKEDLLHSSYETAFGAYKTLLQQETRVTPRLFPVTEFVQHIAATRPLMVALRRAGLAEDMKSQFVAYAADLIECRIQDLKMSSTVEPKLAARMLAAALIESIDWWFDHESVASAEIDAAFHQLARTVTANNGSARR